MLKKYTIKNLDCASCAQKVENLLNKRSDIDECTLSFATELLMIESENEIDVHELEKTIQKIEPDVVLIPREKHVHHHAHEEHEHCGCGHDHAHEEHEHCECGHNHAHEEHEHCGCGHDHAHEEHEHCECGHEHAHEEHEHCGCGHDHAHEEHEHCGCGHDHVHEEHEHCGCGHDHVHEEHEHCGCGHDHSHEEHEHCGCGHDHSHEEHEHCECGHDHAHEEHEHCGCGHDHSHEEHEHCECGHEHSHEEHEHCGCGHDHSHEEHEHCGCGHNHSHEEHEHCGCGHDHSHHHHHHNHECGCGHDHGHQEVRTLEQAGTISYTITGLDCASCAMKVEQAIQKMDIVEDAVLNFSTETLQVKAKKVKSEELLQQLQNTINQMEHGVVLTPKKGPRVIEKPQLFKWKENITLICGVIIYIASLFITNQTLNFVGFLVAYILIGYEVILKAVRNILRGEVFDENFLMGIATIGAFCIGEYAEAVAVMLFYSIGEIFQSYAVNKTRSSISALMDIKSEYANIKTNSGIKQVEPEEVRVNDIIVVKVGEKIPLDGIVMKGSSSLDTSSLTGESLPREVHENEEVLAGVVNLTEILEIKVTKPYVDSTVSKILELMENAASKKAPIERFITRFARVYTPTVVGLAVLLAVLPMLIMKDAVFTDWLYRALTFLVVSCPCALVISIPLGLYAGLGKASKMGALIKGGNYLELLKDVDTVVFDKTGTLTHGKFDVVEVNGQDDLLMYGAYGEFYSNHPIAKSIVAKYEHAIDETQIKDFREVAGKGIEVMIQGKHVVLGNQSFFEEQHIEVVVPQTVGTIVYVAIERNFAGSIVVADKIKETTVKGIQALKEIGVKNTVMLTGDHHRVANDVASKLGIDTVYSELLPQDKVTQVEKLLHKDGCVAFVGDGINDAPVLARADVGIAMGGVGSDAAIEAADVVLMQDNIETIKDAIAISYKTNKILKQNVIFTLVIKIGVLILTMLGLSNMWMGVFADVGVTLIAILNSMRVLK